MPWTTLATTDVLAEFTPAEQTTLQNIQGSTSNLATILTQTVKKTRSLINAGGNQLDQTGLTVPDGLVLEVIAITRWRWLIGMPQMKALQTPDRKDSHDTALKLLERIASQEPTRPRTELPAIADSTPVPLAQPSMGAPRPREFTNWSQNG